MELPTYLTKGADLNFEATLEYQNIYKEVYIIVIDEPTQEFIDVFKELGEYDTTKSPLDNYVEIQMESIRGNMSKVASESALRKIKTQSGEALVYDVSGFQDGIDEEMGFSVSFMQGKLCLYMIMTWTFQKSKSVYQTDMDNMLASFKELSGAIDTFPHYYATNKYSLDIPHGFIADTSVCVEGCLGFSRYEGNLFLAITEFDQAVWKAGYKSWGDKKNYSLLEYFTFQQRKFQRENSAVGTTHAEIRKGKKNNLYFCSFSKTEPEEEEDMKWYYETMIFQGKTDFYYIEVYCPLDQADSNRSEIDAMYDSFIEKK